MSPWTPILFFAVGVVVAIVSSVTASTSSCRGGATFLAPQDGSTYHTPILYPCNNINALINHINNIKAKTSDVFVSYYVDGKMKVRRSLQLASTSSLVAPTEPTDDDDDEDGDEDDDDDDDDLYSSPSSGDHHQDNNEIDPSAHVVPILPTPTLPHNHLLPSSNQFSSSSYSHQQISVTPTHSSQLFSSTAPLQLMSSAALLHDKIYPGGSGEPPPQPETTTITPPPITATAPNTRMIKLQKLLLPSGVPHRLPLDSPHHPCTRITDDSSSPSKQTTLHWLTVEGTTLYFLPTPDDISDYDLTIHCDSTHNNNKDSSPSPSPSSLKFSLFVSVRQRHRSRNWNHAFTLNYATVNNSIPNLIAAIDNIKQTLTPNVSRETDLILIKIKKDAYPYSLTYTNESILIHSNNIGSCPVSPLTSVLSSLTTKLLHRRPTPSLEIKSVSLAPLTDSSQICAGGQLLNTTNTKQTTPPLSSSNNNYPPSIKNQIDVISGTVGQYLTYKIPYDFCYDPEDGPTPRLTLTLKDLKTYEQFDPTFWLQLDTKNSEIYGLPMTTQTFSAVIVCQDQHGKSAQDVIELKVTPPPHPHQHQQYSALFSLHFSSPKFTPPTTRRFVDKLSQLLSPAILVKSIEESSGHVIFSWYNSSNPSDELSLTAIRKIIFTDEGGVTKHARNHFSPEFNLTSSGGVVPVGGTLLAGNTPVTNLNNKNLFDFDMDNKNSPTEDDNNNVGNQDDNAVSINNDILDRFLNDSTYLTTYIVPSILIAVMILLALVIACLLSRKKAGATTTAAAADYYYDDDFRGSNSKKNIAMTTTHNNHLMMQQGGSMGGVPVIFQEELEQQQLIAKQQQQQQQQYVAPPPHPTSRATTPSSNQHQHKQGPPAPPDYYSSTQRSSTSSSRQGSQPPPQSMHHHHQMMMPPPGYHPQQQQQQQQQLPIQSYQPPPALLLHRQHPQHQQMQQQQTQQHQYNMRSSAAPPGNHTHYTPPYVPP